MTELNNHINIFKKCLYQKDYLNVLDELVTIAQNFSNDPDLEDEAVLLNFKLKKRLSYIEDRAERTAQFETIAQEAEELISRIRQDYLTNQELGKQRRQRGAAVRAKFLRQKPVEDLVLKAEGITGQVNRSEVNYILHRLNLISYKDRRWEELSGGFQMRFELARMLVWKPKLLILDEPLAQLDINAQSLFMQDLRFLVDTIRHPMAAVVCSQHLHQIENVSDKIVFLKQGRAAFNGPIEGVGKDRDRNYYEMVCNISNEILEKNKRSTAGMG